MRRTEVIERTLRAVELAEDHVPAGIGFSARWRTNGRAGFNPRGHVNHTTEDAGPIGWSTLYRILRDGHGAISGNALCNTAIRQTGRIVVMASGTAWHAGAGGWRGLSGNASVWGTEYQRGQSQRLTPDMLEAGRIWDWALSQAFGWPVANICEHFEWAPGRKPDRRVRDGVRIDAAVWRSSVRRPTTPQPEPEPDPDPQPDPEVIPMGTPVHIDSRGGIAYRPDHDRKVLVPFGDRWEADSWAGRRDWPGESVVVSKRDLDRQGWTVLPSR